MDAFESLKGFNESEYTEKMFIQDLAVFTKERHAKVLEVICSRIREVVWSSEF